MRKMNEQELSTVAGGDTFLDASVHLENIGIAIGDYSQATGKGDNVNGSFNTAVVDSFNTDSFNKLKSISEVFSRNVVP